MARAPTALERFYEPTPDEAKIASDAQAVYATLDMTPLEIFGDLNQSQSYFDRVPIQDPQPATTQIPAAINDSELAEAKRKLRTVMAEFMFYRFSTTGDPQTDVNRYIAWRHHRGDVVKPRDDRWLFWEENYESIMGMPLAPGYNLDRAYRDIHLKCEAQLPEASRIVSISTDPGESLFLTYWVHNHIWDDQPVITHPRGKEYWLGGKAGGFSTYFKCALEDPRQFTRVQVNLYAVAGVLIEAADGSRYPITLKLIWNTETKDWMIFGLGVANADLAKVRGLVL
ncbi:MAG: hypothetical protein R3B67_07205 [Phycisphaerales bacterium]